MNELLMEVRDVRESERVIVGIVAPYDETSYLVGDPAGERVTRGAFARSIQHRGAKVPLLRNHDRSRKLGTSRTFAEDPAGLIGEFVVNAGDHGDALLEDVRNGYLESMSAGFVPVGPIRRGLDGAAEIREAKLVEVSLVAVPAYEGAAMLAVRHASPVPVEFPPRPNVNLAPIPPILYRPR